MRRLRSTDDTIWGDGISWPPVARLLRGEVMSLRSGEFVEAAVLSGQTHATIIWRQIMPNALSPIIGRVKEALMV
jgi:ABC-type dipeptide/oligopeptide/nickel transport system permease subunit